MYLTPILIVFIYFIFYLKKINPLIDSRSTYEVGKVNFITKKQKQKKT